MSGGGSRKGVPNKRSMLALYEMQEQGVEPIKMLMEVYRRALSSYDECRGLSDKGDSGPAYLAVAQQAASKLASFRYPTLSAVAIKELSELEKTDHRPINTREAIEILKKDPFAAKDILAINPNEKKENLMEGLPIGDANKVKE
jgi:hypothetical protein